MEAGKKPYGIFREWQRMMQEEIDRQAGRQTDDR